MYKPRDYAESLYLRKFLYAESLYLRKFLSKCTILCPQCKNPTWPISVNTMIHSNIKTGEFFVYAHCRKSFSTDCYAMCSYNRVWLSNPKTFRLHFNKVAHRHPHYR